jgi:putative membrane protein
MMWSYGDWSWGGWLAMVLSMVLFWGLVGALVLVVARSLFLQRRSEQPQPSPEEILASRFARGEIDADEYHSRLEALRSTRTKNGRPPSWRR